MLANTSRFATYAALNRMHRNKPFKDLVNSTVWKNYDTVKLKNATYRVALIPASMEFRPDLISAAAYGTKNLWWLICTANAIIDPNTELVSGKQIILPII